MTKIKLDDMLENFKKGGFHLSLVTRAVKSSQDTTTEELVGIVTLEDILEEIICAEIVDETDKYMSNRGKKFTAGPKTLSKGSYPHHVTYLYHRLFGRFFIRPCI